jgi:hypothetical protein
MMVAGQMVQTLWTDGNTTTLRQCNVFYTLYKLLQKFIVKLQYALTTIICSSIYGLSII